MSKSFEKVFGREMIDAADVCLTFSEVMQGATAGVMRQVTNLRDRRKDARGLSTADDGWGIHIEGCCGELAAAKALNVYWTGSHGHLRAPDIGGAWEVRTGARPHHKLILHESDADSAVFILMLGRAPAYRVAGWIRGRDGKQQKWWDDPVGGRAAYFVPNRELRSITDIPRF